MRSVTARADVFVSDAQVMSRRPWGVIDPPLTIIISCAMPVIGAVYLGVAEGKRKSFRDVKHYRRRKRWLA